MGRGCFTYSGKLYIIEGMINYDKLNILESRGDKQLITAPGSRVLLGLDSKRIRPDFLNGNGDPIVGVKAYIDGTEWRLRSLKGKVDAYVQGDLPVGPIEIREFNVRLSEIKKRIDYISW